MKNAFTSRLIFQCFVVSMISYLIVCSGNCMSCMLYYPVWWPGLENIPIATHACSKRRLKWV
jgi:hypothetical protein